MVKQSNLETNSSEAVDPSGFFLEKLDLISMNGLVSDIRDSAVFLKITESLSLMSSICYVELVDGLELFSKHTVSGMEKIHLIISRKEYHTGITTKINKVFHVTEIPNYGKPNPHNAVFSLVAVSEQAYLNKLQQISKVHIGNTNKIIKDIFSSYLNYKDPIIDEGLVNSNFKYLSTFQNPLEICNIIVSRSFGENSTPFFLYETISENYKLSSLKSIYEKPVYRDFEYNAFMNETNLTKQSYLEKLKKVISINSNVNSTRYDSFDNGVLSSVQYHVDIKSGTHERRFFESYKNKINLNKNFVINVNQEIGGKRISEFKEQKYFTILEYPLYDNYKYTNSTLKDNLHLRDCYLENMKLFSHTLEVYGDLNLNPGKKITLKLPRAILLEDETKLYDDYLSGNYIISEVTHKFSNQDYKCSIEVFSDSTNKDLK